MAMPNAENNSQLTIEAADLALYRAKKQDRNRVVVDSESMTEREKLRNN